MPCDLLPEGLAQRIGADWPGRRVARHHRLGAVTPDYHQTADVDHAPDAGSPGRLEYVESPLHIDIETQIVEGIVLVRPGVTWRHCQVQHRLDAVQCARQRLPVEQINADMARIPGLVEREQTQLELLFEERNDTVSHFATCASDEDQSHNEPPFRGSHSRR